MHAGAFSQCDVAEIDQSALLVWDPARDHFLQSWRLLAIDGFEAGAARPMESAVWMQSEARACNARCGRGLRVPASPISAGEE